MFIQWDSLLTLYIVEGEIRVVIPLSNFGEGERGGELRKNKYLLSCLAFLLDER